MTKYPNLLELIKYHQYSEATVCAHAGITAELFNSVMNEGATMQITELIRLALLYECPAEILNCHKIIMMDLERWRHRKMAAQVDALYMQLDYMAKHENNAEAAWRLKYAAKEYPKFTEAAHGNKLSYCHYWGMHMGLLSSVRSAAPPIFRRGINTCRAAAIT